MPMEKIMKAMNSTWRLMNNSWEAEWPSVAWVWIMSCHWPFRFGLLLKCQACYANITAYISPGPVKGNCHICRDEAIIFSVKSQLCGYSMSNAHPVPQGVKNKYAALLLYDTFWALLRQNVQSVLEIKCGLWDVYQRRRPHLLVG